MKRAIRTLGMGLAMSISSMAMAEHGYGGGYGEEYSGGPRYDYAEVVGVDPIIENVRESVPREVCWNERAHQPRGHAYGQPRNNAGATVLGAIIGGALGNNVGHGRGRRAATIGGAVIGGAIGNSVARNNDRYYGDGPYANRGNGSHHERQCRVEEDVIDREQVVGYNVTYRYNGQMFHTRTDAHPGDRIRVEVIVRPVG